MKQTFIYILLLIPILTWAQEERKYIRSGYKAYMNGEYNDAEVDFRKAEEADPNSFTARYNTATSLFQQKNLEESGKVFSDLMSEAPTDNEQAKLLHNMGNVLLENDKYQEAADAYKKSLKLNPKDEDTRYNLAYALQKLDEQQQQQQNQEQENQDQENKENQDKQDKQNQENQQDQENQDQQDKEQQQQQNQDQQKDEQKEQEQQPQKMELSKEEAERLLNAILQKEKDVKEKVDKKKAAGAKVKTEKDW